MQHGSACSASAARAASSRVNASTSTTPRGRAASTSPRYCRLSFFRSVEAAEVAGVEWQLQNVQRTQAWIENASRWACSDAGLLATQDYLELLELEVAELAARVERALGVAGTSRQHERGVMVPRQSGKLLRAFHSLALCRRPRPDSPKASSSSRCRSASRSFR